MYDTYYSILSNIFYLKFIFIFFEETDFKKWTGIGVMGVFEEEGAITQVICLSAKNSGICTQKLKFL